MRFQTPIVIFLISLSAFSQNNRRDQERLLDYMVDNYAKLQEPQIKDFLRHCPRMQHTTGPNQSFCTTVYQNRKDLLDRMSSLIGKVRNQNITHEQAIDVISCLPVNPPAFDDLEQILKRLDSKQDCSPLEKGDFKVSDFLLQRKADGNYEAIVNLNFRNVSGNVSPDAMRNQINQCLSQFTPYLKSPAGETLNIRIMSPQEVAAALPIGQRPREIEVKIHKGKTINEKGEEEQFRANSLNYPDNIPCPTMLHETLHHLGLCDEYAEHSTTNLPNSTRSFKEAYSCRVVPQQNTVMNQQVTAIAEVVPQKFSCRCKDEGCRNSLRGNDENARNVRELFLTGDSYTMIPPAVMRNCRTDYLDPRLHPFTNPGKRAVLISSNEYSMRFDHRYASLLPALAGKGPSYTISRRLVECNCNGDRECLSALPRALELVRNNPRAQSCPGEMENIPLSNNRPAPGESSGVSGDVLTIITTPKRGGSLLHANHFNRILFGDCMQGPVANYNTCASFAYKSTTDAECSSKPASCGQDSFFLGGTSQ